MSQRPLVRGGDGEQAVVAEGDSCVGRGMCGAGNVLVLIRSGFFFFVKTLLFVFAPRDLAGRWFSRRAVLVDCDAGERVVDV